MPCRVSHLFCSQGRAGLAHRGAVKLTLAAPGSLALRTRLILCHRERRSPPPVLVATLLASLSHRVPSPSCHGPQEGGWEPITPAPRFLPFSSISSADGSREAPGKKSTSKRKHLQCHDCQTLLEDNYQFSHCPLCHARYKQEPTIQDMVVWVKDFLSSNMNSMGASIDELKQMVSAKRSRPASPPRSMEVSGEAARDDSQSSSSEEEDKFQYFFFSGENTEAAKVYQVGGP
ncbi:uncharacterized protein LOC130279749 [Hyla sarda]|uniref:uncharacterized protein LOC130279749 n=1 Tax=Hyla sarda TaxID=327740 RepID=UPI0024C3BC3F|nr:uncharacterized protein LOC130279749 [Hyla sarda]